MSNEVMNNAPGIFKVPPEEASWLKSSLASFGSASRSMLLGATALVSVCASGPASAQQPTLTKPNVVVLMMDDVGWSDFGAYTGGGKALGHPTPNIDRVAKEGATFTSWYGQSSCTAGRSSFITGRIPIRTALSVVVAPPASLPPRSRESHTIT
jgi:hypothetical protein